MIHKCRCLNPQTNCFSGMCRYCSGEIDNYRFPEFLKITSSQLNVGTFCNKCMKVFCICNKIKVE